MWMSMALTAQSKVRRNVNVTRLEYNRLTIVAAVGFHDNNSDITQRFIEACGRVGIPIRADLNTSGGTVGVAKVGVLNKSFVTLT
jgi:hypothetical protein